MIRTKNNHKTVITNSNKQNSHSNNSVNLIIQSGLQPFSKKDSQFITKDMHMHKIPWLNEVLESSFDAPVEMKVTLSYFIELGPGQIGWKDRY